MPTYPPVGTVAAVVPDSSCEIHISRDAEHPDWDAFLKRTPGGHHAQTSLWAQLKAQLGWEVARVIAIREGHIVAGAQMLIRPLALVGAVGYVPKGPVCAEEDPELAGLILHELHRVARTCHVHYLAVQPPNNGHALVSRLLGWGSPPSAIPVGQPTATLLLDLAKDLDGILADMHASTRYNIRLGLRRGVVVRQGRERDLPTFWRLLEATGRRQGFAPEHETYLSQMYRLLAPRGWLRLFIAEYQGEAVSAALLIAFGDTVFYKRGAWSGRHGKHHPNEVLQWELIQWAKAQGYRTYDFEGIEPACARAVLRGETIPESLSRTVTSFKLGFGGRVALFPGVYDYVYNPLLRWVYHAACSGLEHSVVIQWILDHLRTNAKGGREPARRVGRSIPI